MKEFLRLVWVMSGLPKAALASSGSVVAQGLEAIRRETIGKKMSRNG